MNTNVDANSLHYIFEPEPTKRTKKSQPAVPVNNFFKSTQTLRVVFCCQILTDRMKKEPQRFERFGLRMFGYACLRRSCTNDDRFLVFKVRINLNP